MAEQANMLLSGARDANDNIRDQNAVATRTWETTDKDDKRDKEGESWYHGVTDTVGGAGLVKSGYDTAQRMSKLGIGFGELASRDASNAGSTLSAIGQGAKSGITTIAGGVKSAGVSVGAIKGSTNLADLTSETMGLSRGAAVNLPTSAPTPTPTPTPETTAPTPTTDTAPTPDTDAPPTSTATTGGNTANDIGEATEATESGGGTLTGKVISKLSGGTIAAEGVAAEGLSKVAGNVGGAVDLYKDFDNIGKKGGFFGGTGSSTTDEIGNVLTVGGTALDVASMALPFLAPLAAAVQLGGAAVGTYTAIKDSDTQTTNDKGKYQSNLVNYEVPPSLAGTGFLASAQSDTKKLITGSSTF